MMKTQCQTRRPQTGQIVARTVALSITTTASVIVSSCTVACAIEPYRRPQCKTRALIDCLAHSEVILGS